MRVSLPPLLALSRVWFPLPLTTREWPPPTSVSSPEPPRIVVGPVPATTLLLPSETFKTSVPVPPINVSLAASALPAHQSLVAGPADDKTHAAADQGVVASAALKRIHSRSADETVIALLHCQEIVARSANERVGRAGNGAAFQQIISSTRHKPGLAAANQSVVAAATQQRIQAGAAHERVIAVLHLYPLVAGAANERIASRPVIDYGRRPIAGADDNAARRGEVEYRPRRRRTVESSSDVITSTLVPGAIVSS